MRESVRTRDMGHDESHLIHDMYSMVGLHILCGM